MKSNPLSVSVDLMKADSEGGIWSRIDDEGFFGLIGPIHQLSHQDGSVGRFRFETNDNHRNRRGTVHGGLILALADRAMGLTARQLDTERNHATVQLDMFFVHAAGIGADIAIECQVIRETRSLVFLEVEMHSAGHVVAKGKGIWRNFAKPEGA